MQPGRDGRRDADLRARGYTVLHFTNDDVMDDAEAVARAIEVKIEQLRILALQPRQQLAVALEDFGQFIGSMLRHVACILVLE
ncbi:DUF559 domain-containing protein [Qipengyuania pacifica]|uniref:DUF559 domain-containing protein n=1 Tax=Qipengyuania pacifica TaxID=2860199 RepID=UPI0032119AD2